MSFYDTEGTPVSTHAPLAGSDFQQGHCRGSDQGFNPRSPCGERPAACDVSGLLAHVSTHAPLAGSDCRNGDAGGNLGFQPTLPLRGATGFP